MQSLLADLFEVRIYGLNITITTEALGEYLGKGDIVRLRGILLHPLANSTFQWAQVWVTTEVEVAHLLSLRDALAVNGITISQFGSSTVTPPHTPWDLMSLKPSLAPSGLPLSSASTSLYGRPDANSAPPRNLYILNLPLDLTQIEFKSLFTPYGVVEHSILLSQLDGFGRRRGFVLMSCHREAAETMRHMHGKWIDGSKLDVSWALVQRETKTISSNPLPNRVVHPPAVSARREPSPEFSVVVENLDPHLFPDSETVSSIFRSFGPIDRTIKLSDTSVLINFDHQVSATALVNANGLKLGDRTLITKRLQSVRDQTPWLDEFNPLQLRINEPTTPQSSSHSSRLNADSRPFIPGDNLSPNHMGSSTQSSSSRSDKSPFFPVESGTDHE